MRKGCKKLNEDSTCKDNPGVRCVNVPAARCQPELTNKEKTTKE